MSYFFMNNGYTLTVGLEVHAELKTRTKMFCHSKNDPDETRPNVNICPVCMGHPGTLPVMNKEAVKHVLKVGLAIGGKLADYTEFDRKNYFYPDIPKGYQLSQYEFPLVSGGTLNGIAITRVHLEEDTATLIHADVREADSRELIHEELTYKIRGAAFKVYNALGSGHKESVYQNALAEQLKHDDVVYEKEKHIPIAYADVRVGSYQPDFLVGGEVLVELKALPFIGRIEKEQVLYYLKNTHYRLALIINFGSTPIQIERIVCDSIHDNQSANQRQSASLVDFNRAGVPLMELVTEPVIHSAKEAGDFARELQLLFRYLGVSDANMEKGEMRVEANISVSKQTDITDKRRFEGTRINADTDSIRDNPCVYPRPSAPLGTKVEVKNLNSFRSVERAIAYEVERHTAILEAGEKVLQETRGWDETAGKTFSQRRKEESNDYRYFPDPDLPKLNIRDIDDFNPRHLRTEMPELPNEKRARYGKLGIKENDTEILVANRSLGAFFDTVAEILKQKEPVLLAGNYLTSDLMGLIKKSGKDADTIVLPFSAQAFAELILMVHEKKLSSRGAKDMLQVLFEKGGKPEELISELGLAQKSDHGELKAIVESIVATNAEVVQDYKNGKMAALQFLVGQGMKATKGSANPEMLREIFVELLK